METKILSPFYWGLFLVIAFSCQQKKAEPPPRPKNHNGVYAQNHMVMGIKIAWILKDNRLDIYSSLLESTETMYIEQTENSVKLEDKTYLVDKGEIFITNTFGTQITMIKISDNVNMDLIELKKLLDIMYRENK